MFLKSNDSYSHPDIEVEVLMGVCVDTYNYAVTGPNPTYVTPFPQGNYVSFGLSNTRSEIKGTIEISSNSFLDRPKIDLNWTIANLPPTSSEYLGLKYGLDVIDRLVNETAWGQTYIDRNIFPAGTYFGDPYVYFLYSAYEIYHLHGSNPLGLVTDLQGRVLGVQGLTLCDLSLVPNVDGNPTMTMLSMCEKIAESLLSRE